MDALAEPPALRVRFRFTHALAGWTGAVDVHVNGQVLSNVRYGHESADVAFYARDAGQDTLVVVPASLQPDGPYVLWSRRGADLFDEGDVVDAFFVHETHDPYRGDVTGDYRVIFDIGN